MCHHISNEIIERIKTDIDKSLKDLKHPIAEVQTILNSNRVIVFLKLRMNQQSGLRVMVELGRVL